MGERILSTPVLAGGTARQGANVALGDIVTLKREPASLIERRSRSPGGWKVSWVSAIKSIRGKASRTLLAVARRVASSGP